MDILLFGPPGIGKSTLVEAINSPIFAELRGHLNVSAFDLETIKVEKGSTLEQLRDAEKSKWRDLAQSKVTYIIGAAALDPKFNYGRTLKVFLYAPQAEYVRRRAERDALFPGKANQREHLIADWMKGTHYDFVMDLSQPAAVSEAERILAQAYALITIASYTRLSTFKLNK